MTAEQPSHFHTTLNGLFEGNGAAVAVRLECSSVSCYSWTEAAPFIPVTTAEGRFGISFGDARPTAAQPGASCYRLDSSERHSIPIAPAPCERLSPTAF
jgi:hypothetical protein